MRIAPRWNFKIITLDAQSDGMLFLLSWCVRTLIKHVVRRHSTNHCLSTFIIQRCFARTHLTRVRCFSPGIIWSWNAWWCRFDVQQMPFSKACMQEKNNDKTVQIRQKISSLYWTTFVNLFKKVIYKYLIFYCVVYCFIYVVIFKRNM